MYKLIQVDQRSQPASTGTGALAATSTHGHLRATTSTSWFSHFFSAISSSTNDDGSTGILPPAQCFSRIGHAKIFIFVFDSSGELVGKGLSNDI